MISRVRWHQWETNSSTMNQFAIHLNSNAENGMYDDTLVLNYDFNMDEGIMYSDFPTKAKIMYTAIEQMAYEANYEPEYQKERFINLSKLYKDVFLSTLDRHNIKYKLDGDGDFENIDIFGLSGINEIEWMSDTEMVEKFLFDPASVFTFGYDNCWPSKDDLGYTGVKVNEDDYHTITI